MRGPLHFYAHFCEVCCQTKQARNRSSPIVPGRFIELGDVLRLRGFRHARAVSVNLGFATNQRAGDDTEQHQGSYDFHIDSFKSSGIAL